MAFYKSRVDPFLKKKEYQFGEFGPCSNSPGYSSTIKISEEDKDQQRKKCSM